MEREACPPHHTQLGPIEVCNHTSTERFTQHPSIQGKAVPKRNAIRHNPRAELHINGPEVMAEHIILFFFLLTCSTQRFVVMIWFFRFCKRQRMYLNDITIQLCVLNAILILTIFFRGFRWASKKSHFFLSPHYTLLSSVNNQLQYIYSLPQSSGSSGTLKGAGKYPMDNPISIHASNDVFSPLASIDCEPTCFPELQSISNAPGTDALLPHAFKMQHHFFYCILAMFS